MKYDLVIGGGDVVDPGSGLRGRMDVAISGGKIVEVAVNYGSFLQNVINFLIVAFVLFIFIKKFLGWVLRSKQQEAAAPPPPTKDQELLTEIRDLLKQRAA